MTRRALIEAAKEWQEYYAAIQDLSQVFGLEFETTRKRFTSIVADRPVMSWRECYRMIVHGFQLGILSEMQGDAAIHNAAIFAVDGAANDPHGGVTLMEVVE